MLVSKISQGYTTLNFCTFVCGILFISIFLIFLFFMVYLEKSKTKKNISKKNVLNGITLPSCDKGTFTHCD